MKEPLPIIWEKKHVHESLGIVPPVESDDVDHVFSGVSIDSRRIEQGQLFVALRGDKFDGHSFVLKLAQNGIKGFVVENSFLLQLEAETRNLIEKGGAVFFGVDDTHAALGALAGYQRRRAGVKVVAITGSNGKTTTRKMVSRIFETRFNTLSTKGNFNNEVGLPLTLLNLSGEHEWAVVELGMNHAGEMTRLGNIAKPDIGIITNIAHAHLEGLGTLDEVAMAKAELLETMDCRGWAVLNGDDSKTPMISERVRSGFEIKNQLVFSRSGNGQVVSESPRIENGKTVFTLVNTAVEENIEVSLKTPALFMVENALAASCAALCAGISMEDIQTGLGRFSPVSGRMKFLRAGGFNLIDDTYNANPDSVKKALKTLKVVSGEEASCAVLGDMLELGSGSKDLHVNIGREVALLGISKLYVHGEYAGCVARGAKEQGLGLENIMVGSKEDITRALLQSCSGGTFILVKGSRGMKMETIVQEIKQTDSEIP